MDLSTSGERNGEAKKDVESKQEVVELPKWFDSNSKETMLTSESEISKEASEIDPNFLHVDPCIDQVDENHYVIKRGSTLVHVQTYAASNASDVINLSEESTGWASAWNLISVLVAMITVAITVCIKLSASLSEQVYPLTSNVYMLILFIAGFLWSTVYSFYGLCNSQLQIRFSKTNQTSNRWLKGVVILFGLGIVLKCGLQFLSYLSVDLSHCPENRVNATLPFFNILFVLSQIRFLFRFSKVFIRNASCGSRLGIMLVIAINLSIWIVTIIDETMMALGINEEHVDTIHHLHEAESDVKSKHKRAAPSPNATNDLNLTHLDYEEAMGCYCHSNFCNTVHTGEKFLFPFVIEFSLVASCLLYVTWSNIGKQPTPCEEVVKPSHKLHNSYSGVIVGAVILFGTIVALLYLGTTSGEVSHGSNRNFADQYDLLLTYNWFLISVELCMLVACIWGFYLFYRIRRPLEKCAALDKVLLMICLLGPLALDIFTMIAVVIGKDNKIAGWSVTLATPLCDILQCILQLVFILYGLRREPITTKHAKETEAHIRHGIHQHFKSSGSSPQPSKDEEFNHKKTFLRSNRTSISKAVSRLAYANANQAHPDGDSSRSDYALLPKRYDPALEVIPEEGIEFPPRVVITGEGETSLESNEIFEQTSLDTPPLQPSALPSTDEASSKRSQAILKIVSETKIARPCRDRLWLRGVIMFLLICNASLWMFMSLDGTAFVVTGYQREFFGESAWTAIAMICRPLNIFFRMHSAGCLFEIWSYA
ncbi:proton channel OTOP2-like isoform X1 [Clavelina lepadiformis]|uniref:proton channel OTOP2-like isoform X1 n=1 Tax=Clavelina lepadiformis TaxID=159417 RepID=UPI0040428412